jgi:hypothetical protein
MDTIIMENATLPAPDQPKNTAIRILAHFISYVFHPIFIPSYVTAFLVYIHPYAFAGFDSKTKFFRVLFVVFDTAFLPLFSVFLMYALKLIKSVQLKTQKERIIPYAAAMVFFFWAWYVSKNLSDSPESFIQFLLGTFIAVMGAWMYNIYMKISMHAIAMGGLVAFFLLQVLLREEDATGLYLSVAIVIAGLVCTSRLIVSDHHPREVYGGLLIGALSQLIAFWIG